MTMFAVIKIRRDYDLIENVECVASFTDKAKAEECVVETMKERSELQRRHRDYVEKYVESIEIPDVRCIDAWTAFVERYAPLVRIGVSPSSFKRSLAGALHKGYKPNIPLHDYNPPNIADAYCENYVIEICDPTVN